MPARRIIVSVINNYESDQRVQKVCSSLQKFGFEVEVIATTLRGKPNLNFPYPTHQLKLYFQKGMMLYVEFNLKLFFKLIKVSKKGNILLANDLDALLPNFWVSKIKGLELVFDSHEIFSELPSLHGRNFKKKIWKYLEKSLVPKMKYFYTVSDGYANWFEKEYGNLPKIIKNVPAISSTKDDLDSVDLPKLNDEEKLILYQGVLNYSRGIDKMIEAMLYIENAQLWIIGNGPKMEEFQSLQSRLNLAEKVKFLGNIKPSLLKKITSKADVGLSLEEDLGISYRYALPNKIFDYMHASVPILGTYLPEIKQLIEKYEIGKIIDNHDPQHIGSKINQILSEGKSSYLENLQRASKDFNWENEEQKLREIYSSLNVQM